MSARIHVAIFALACGAWCSSAAAQAEGRGPAGATSRPVSGVVVLDTAGFWRMHHTLAPPVAAMPGGLQTISIGYKWMDQETPPPPEGWTRPDFDDGEWFRGPAQRSMQSPYLSRLCLRGKFQVNDPAQVSGLRLTVGYHGGAVVSVNGKEVARGQLPAGALDKSAVAEAYPQEAFVGEDGSLLLGEQIRRWVLSPTPATARRIALQNRVLEAIPVPRELLRKGVNVVAVEVVRAPYDRAVEEKKAKRGHATHPYDLAWNTCQITQVRLTAEEAGGLVPNATRPTGLQVWNSDPMASDFDLDFGDRCESLRPIRLAGVRNGAYSGKVVVGSTTPIQDLRAAPGDLKSAQGTIPASAVQVRCAVPWGVDHLVYPYSGTPSPYPAEASLLGALVDLPVAEVPVRTKPSGRAHLQSPGQPATVFGAVAPVWVTVKVPKDAQPGVYEGSVTIAANGEPAVRVPVRLEVADWALNDPHDWRTWVEVVESPDTLAQEYGVEMWSAKHMAMVGKSFDFMAQLGSGVVYVPLICHTHYGNDESMVRWVKRDGGKYDFDFSAMDRYLDLAEKRLGKPKIVCFQAWDVYMIPLEQPKDVREDVRVREHLAKSGSLVGKGPAVTMVDPATSEREMVYLPRYEEPGSVELWKPLFDQLRQRLAKRGLEKAMTLGLFPDVWATKGEVAALKEASGNLPWTIQSHNGAGGTRDGVYGLASCAYQSRVWLLRYATEEKGSLHGWKRPELLAAFHRNLGFVNYPLSNWRTYPELAITGDQRGVARLGAEFWDVLRDKQGQRKGTVTARYPQSSWRNLDPWAALLAPGPDGPVATTRFEAFREGVQDCEARICLEQALLDKAAREKLGDDLAQRCDRALAQRLRDMWRARSSLLLGEWHGGFGPHTMGIAGNIWYVGSGWQERARELYSLAAEVQKKLQP